MSQEQESCQSGLGRQLIMELCHTVTRHVAHVRSDHVRNGLLAPAEVTEIANLFHKYFTNMMFLFTFPWMRKQLGLRVYIVSRHFLQHTRRRHHSCWHLLQVSFPPFWTSSNTGYMSDCHTVTLPLLLTNTEPQCSKYAITLRGLVFATQPHCGQQRSSPAAARATMNLK